MKKYGNLKGDSGVTAYETGDNYIRVEFGDSIYLYTYKSVGKTMVEKMKVLADKGRGLSTYISRYVRDKYESKTKTK